MASYKMEPISKEHLLGEGSHWDETAQALYYVDIQGHEVHKYIPSSGKHTKINTGSWVSLVIPVENKKDKFIITQGRDLALLTWDGKENSAFSIYTITSVDKDKETNFDDGKADAKGRLWAGTMGALRNEFEFDQEQGSFYCFDPLKSPTLQFEKVTISNGITWSLDNKIMYYIDSGTHRVDAFDFDLENGKISNRRPIIDFDKSGLKGFPDGMTIDTEGKLWVCCFFGHQVIRLDPETGEVLFRLSMPSPYVTSVTFGGRNLDELYVTTACNKKALEEYPHAGTTWRITGLGFKGFPGRPVKYNL